MTKRCCRYPTDEELSNALENADMPLVKQLIARKTAENRMQDMVYDAMRRKGTETMPINVLMLICVWVSFRSLLQWAGCFPIFQRILLMDDFWKRRVAHKYGITEDVYGPLQETELHDQLETKHGRSYNSPRRFVDLFWRRYYTVLRQIHRRSLPWQLEIMTYSTSQTFTQIQNISVATKTATVVIVYRNSYMDKSFQWERQVSWKDILNFCISRELFTMQAFEERCAAELARIRARENTPEDRYYLESSSQCHVIMTDDHLKRPDFYLQEKMDVPGSYQSSLAHLIYRGYVFFKESPITASRVGRNELVMAVGPGNIEML